MKNDTLQHKCIELILSYGIDILNAPTMSLQKKFMQHGNISCYGHSIAVTYCSLWLANHIPLKWDYRSIVRGALLHDYYLYDWHIREESLRFHGFRHPRKALDNAKHDFILNEIEADIIIKHMFPLTPKPPKYKESLLVTCGDKFCALLETLSLFSFQQIIQEVEDGCQHESNVTVD